MSFMGGAIGSMIADSVAWGAKALYGDKQAEKQHNRNVDSYRMRHRWEVEDLKLAGLNPILSATTGPGAVPGAAMPNTPTQDNPFSSAQNLMASANEKSELVNKIKAEVKQIGILADKTEQEIKLVIDQSLLAFENAMKAKAEAQIKRYQAGKESVKKEFAFRNQWMLQAEQLSESLGVKLSDIISIFNIISLTRLGKPLIGQGKGALKLDPKKHGIFDKGTGEIFNP